MVQDLCVSLKTNKTRESYVFLNRRKFSREFYFLLYKCFLVLFFFICFWGSGSTHSVHTVAWVPWLVQNVRKPGKWDIIYLLKCPQADTIQRAFNSFIQLCNHQHSHLWENVHLKVSPILPSICPGSPPPLICRPMCCSASVSLGFTALTRVVRWGIFFYLSF